MLTLAQAAERLGLSPGTLRIQARKGALRATLYGKTYLVTEDEVERYRRDHLGKAGRPVGSRDVESRKPSGTTKWSVIKAERVAKRQPPPDPN